MNSAWKEIKTALNSTLSTNNFKPLDMIMIEKFTIINDYIVSIINVLKLK